MRGKLGIDFCDGKLVEWRDHHLIFFMFLVAGMQQAFSLHSPLPCRASARQHQNPLTSVLQIMEKDSADVENVKMNAGIKFGRCLHNGSRSVNNLEDVSIYCASIRASTSIQFNLLNENLDKVEHILADTDSVRLERDILVHIRRIGALKLFYACLSRTHMPLTEVCPNSLLTDHFSYCNKEWPIKQDKIVVPSGKMKERKLRRLRAKEKNSIISSLSLNHKNITKSLDTLQSRSRPMIARNESKLSIAVKEVANLERIRVKLEKDIGEKANHERWAKAAGIDLNTLHQRLHEGWQSRDKLIKSTRTLVLFLARNYDGIGVSFDDLLQAGSMGVLKGAERFDTLRGYRFSTYVQYWIRKSMLSLVSRYSRGIRLPASTVKIIKQVQDASKTFRMREGRFPEDDALADLTSLPLSTIRLARRCFKTVVSLDQWQIADMMELTPDASIETPFDFVMKQHKRKDILELLESLHPRERQVLRMRYGLDDGRSKSFGEIGSLCNVSKEWIRRIERAAMAKIRSRDIQEKINFY